MISLTVVSLGFWKGHILYHPSANLFFLTVLPPPSRYICFFFLLSFSFHHFALKQPRYKRSSYVLGRALVPVVSSSARSMSCHSLLPLSTAGDWRITSQGQCCHHQLNTAITNPLTGVYLLLREGVKERGEKTVESGKKYNPNTDDI